MSGFVGFFFSLNACMQQYRFGKARAAEETEEKGIMTFYHPRGTHDDQLWALALAVYAAKEKEPVPFVRVIPR